MHQKKEDTNFLIFSLDPTIDNTQSQGFEEEKTYTAITFYLTYKHKRMMRNHDDFCDDDDKTRVSLYVSGLDQKSQR